jgi:predicted TIM-barrel fold metal-dependent hydrolase
VPDMRLSDYRPVSKLRLPVHLVDKPRFGVVDAHNHLGPLFSGGWHARPVSALLAALDEAGVETIVDLDGGTGEAFSEHYARYAGAHPGRFAHAAQLSFGEWPERPDFGDVEAGRFEDAVQRGAIGLKVWKLLGLRARDPEGRIVAVDDARLDPLWATGARTGAPIIIHIADPIAFFDPLDERNERWEELAQHPDWHFWPPATADDETGFAAFDQILAAFDRVVGRHPGTTFIGAHVGCAAEDLSLVSSMLDRHPNLYVDLSARMAELGRQPYTSRAFFLRHADRILFGTDLGFDPAMYRLHYRFLESMDESFDYSTESAPPQGRWQIHGLGLPDDVLKQVYADNARRVLLNRSAR